MIFFITFDAGLLLGFIIILICILFNGIASVLTAVTAHYAAIMIVTLILSLIASFGSGAVLSDFDKRGDGEWQSIISALLFGPPVALLAMNEILGMLDMFSKISILELIILGIVYVIILLIVLTLYLIVGLGIPIAAQYLLCKAFGKWGYLIAGIIFGVLYYYILYRYNVFPFSTQIN